MKRTTLILLAMATWARGETMPLYYDYVEDGKLAGGKIMIDPADPDDRATFGLDGYAGRMAWPVTTIADNGPAANRVDLVMLGDGYTESELDAYASHVLAVFGEFFAEHPIAAYAGYFNVHRVDVVSNESGVDEPDSGIFRDTALDMAYDCAGIARLLCINVGKAYAAAANAPDVDQILALANSTRYGGAGYTDLCTLAGNSSAAVELALHEFGHSFGDLADEYDYGDGAVYSGPEPWEVNVSIHDAAAQIALQTKWHLWMDLPNVNTFEGSYYNQFGVYRPTSSSKMRSLNRPFEEINAEQLILAIYEIVSPIDDATPLSGEPLSACTTFYVVPMQPSGHTLDVQWSVDGELVPGANATAFEVDAASLAPGVHEVSVSVTDNTAHVRDESARGLRMTDSRQWEIAVTSGPSGCEIAPPLPAAYPHDRRKNRYVSFDPNKAVNDGASIAFKVEMLGINQGSCDDGTGAQGGNGDFCRTDRGAADCKACSASGDSCISASIDCPPGESCDPTGATCVNDLPNSGGSNVGIIWWVGPGKNTATEPNLSIHLLVSEPFRKESTNWPNPTHAGDCEVVPQARYGVRAVETAGGSESDELVVLTTALNVCSVSGDLCNVDGDCPAGETCDPVGSPAPFWWGDVVGVLAFHCNADIREATCVDSGDCGGDPCERAWELPNGVTNLDDVTAALWTSAPAPPTTVSADFTWVDVHGNDSFTPGSQNFDPPNNKINASDLQQIGSAFGGAPYKFYDPADCPNESDWP